MKIDVRSTIESQFPQLYRDHGDRLVEFFAAYYEYLDALNIRQITSDRDIDAAPERYLPNFLNTYARDINVSRVADKRFVIKHINDLIETKATTEGIELMFRCLFDDNVAVRLPKDHIIAASAGEYITRRAVALTYFPQRFNVARKQIVSPTASATIADVFVIDTRDRGEITVAIVEDIVGEFVARDRVVIDNQYAAKIIPVASSVTVTTTAARSSLPELMITDDRDVAVRPSKTKTQSTARYSVARGGSGYNTNATVITSDYIVTANVPATNTYAVNSTITINTIKLNFTSNTKNFELGANVTTAPNTSLQGTIAAISATSHNNQQSITVTTNNPPANFANQTTVATPQANATIANTEIKTATATVIAVSNTQIATSNTRLLSNFLYDVYTGGTKTATIIFRADDDIFDGNITTSSVITDPTGGANTLVANVTKITQTLAVANTTNILYETPIFTQISTRSNTSASVTATINNEEILVGADANAYGAVAFNNSYYTLETRGEISDIVVNNQFSRDNRVATIKITQNTPNTMFHQAITVDNVSIFADFDDISVVNAQYASKRRVTVANTQNFAANEIITFADGGNTAIAVVSSVINSSSIVVSNFINTGAIAAGNVGNTTFSAINFSNHTGIIAKVEDIVANTVYTSRTSYLYGFASEQIVQTSKGVANVVSVANSSKTCGKDAEISGAFENVGNVVASFELFAGFVPFSTKTTSKVYDGNTWVADVTLNFAGLFNFDSYYVNRKNLPSFGNVLPDGNKWQFFSYDVVTAVGRPDATQSLENLQHTAGSRAFLTFDFVRPVSCSVSAD